MTRQIHLGVFMLGTGNHIAGWRMEGAADSFQNLDVCIDIARIAEAAKFDLLFAGDGYGAHPGQHPSYTVRLDPVPMFAAIATATTHIGLGATASTTYNDPYTIARSFATLDHISHGRAAWNAVTSAHRASGQHFGRPHPEHEARYEIAGEFIDVVKSLWDCWDDDAIRADRATGVYIDWSKVRPLKHHGRHFTVDGVLNIGRAPQGHPVVLQAGGSDAGQELAARTADVVFSAVQDFDDARRAYASLKERVRRHGRSPDEVCVLPGVMPIVADTDAEALELLNHLQGFVDETVAGEMLRSRLDITLEAGGLDRPVPDAPLPDSGHAFARNIIAKARRENLMLRDLYNLVAAARGHWVLCGSPTTIADTLEKWFTDGAADGFNVLPPYFPAGFKAFTERVVPLLQQRGLFRREYAGRTLRDHFGLPRPDVSRRATMEA